jgi:hypothetical protein
MRQKCEEEFSKSCDLIHETLGINGMSKEMGISCLFQCMCEGAASFMSYENFKILVEMGIQSAKQAWVNNEANTN